jgi:hypothetical protein
MKKTKTMVVSHQQNGGQNVAKFKYLGTTVRNQIAFTRKLNAD